MIPLKNFLKESDDVCKNARPTRGRSMTCNIGCKNTKRGPIGKGEECPWYDRETPEWDLAKKDCSCYSANR